MTEAELRESPLSSTLVRVYGIERFRRPAMSLARRLEGGQFYSKTLRHILKTYHDVEIGAYSYGSCFEPGAFPGGARIGRYVSMASGVLRRLNHPLDRLVMHPYFYNERLGYVPHRILESEPIHIGHDAWIGQSVIFTESCRRVGIGAVIGAGSIVTRDVRDFEVVAGNPARPLKRRFSDPLCETILASRWWERPITELAGFADAIIRPVADLPDTHPLLQHLPARQGGR